MYFVVLVGSKQSVKSDGKGASMSALITSGVVLPIEETDGRETVASARDLFKSVESDFVTRFDRPSAPTDRTGVLVWEADKDCPITSSLAKLERKPVDACLSQAQAIAFLREYAKREPIGNLIFSLLQDGGQVFFCHFLRADGRRFIARKTLLTDGTVMPAPRGGVHFRLVLPV